jgi:hypothetical protein
VLSPPSKTFIESLVFILLSIPIGKSKLSGVNTNALLKRLKVTGKFRNK